MKPIELEIFFLNEQTRALDEADIDYDIEDSDIRPITFYNIDFISPHQDSFNKKWYSKVSVGGETSTCILKYNELKKLIETHNA